MKPLGRILSEIWRAVKFELPSTLGSILTILLAAILPGIIWVSYKNMTQTEARLKSGMTMDVFLRDELTTEQIEHLKIEFAKLRGVASASYVSKDDALSRMKQRFGSEMLEGMENENPLPASFVLNIDQSLFQTGVADALVNKLKTFPEVDDVVFSGDVLVRLGKIMRTVEVVGFALSILVAFAAIFIVANTVRVTISDRRKTVEIMQLVGATRGYILTPFVILGGMLGLLGAALSMASLYWMTGFISKHLVNIIFLEFHEILAFLLIGLLLGMVGAWGATQRYLKI